MQVQNIADFFRGKTVLVTGGAGTVGRELIEQISNYDPAEIRVIDNNEAEIFFLQEGSLNCVGKGKLKAYLGDIRDKETVISQMRGVDIVFHTAALKHVILCERSPRDAILSNILGVENVIDAALVNNVEKLIFTSSDKAVNPTNVMGTSKLMGERLITAANSMKSPGQRTVFSSVRFGNVIGSRGSVVPIFYQQILKGGPITLTSKDMTRFIMTVKESAELVIKAAVKARGGEVFVAKMPSIRIEDLANVMLDVLSDRFEYIDEEIEITEIGIKPGEKLYEELTTYEELRRTVELEDSFVIIPAFTSVYKSIDYTYDGALAQRPELPYTSSSQRALSKESLKDYFNKNDIVSKLSGVYL